LGHREDCSDSTYELGRQPFGLGLAGRWLRAVGHEVTCMDLTRQELDDAANSYRGKDCNLSSDAHGDTVSGAAEFQLWREKNPEARICCYGLYAPMNAEYLRSLGAEKLIGGEFEKELVAWANGAARREFVEHDFAGAVGLQVPDRVGFAGNRKIRAPGFAGRRISRRRINGSKSRL